MNEIHIVSTALWAHIGLGEQGQIIVASGAYAVAELPVSRGEPECDDLTDEQPTQPCKKARKKIPLVPEHDRVSDGKDCRNAEADRCRVHKSNTIDHRHKERKNKKQPNNRAGNDCVYTKEWEAHTELTDQRDHCRRTNAHYTSPDNTPALTQLRLIVVDDVESFDWLNRLFHSYSRRSSRNGLYIIGTTAGSHHPAAFWANRFSNEPFERITTIIADICARKFWIGRLIFTGHNPGHCKEHKQIPRINRIFKP
jgi:hypothetical protein